MHAPVVAPPAAGLFDGVAFGVVVEGEGDVVGTEVVDDNFFSGHSLGGVIMMKSKKSQRPHGCDGGEGAADEKNKRQAA